MGALKRSFVGLVWLFAAAGGLAQELNWVQVTSYLSARMHHAMAYDAARQQVVLFGGEDGNTTFKLNDTWVWDGANWVQKFPATSPPERTVHAMAYDAARGQVVLFGGSGGGSLSNETWVWDGTDWVKKLPSMAPSARAYSAMAYDLVRERMVLFGGYGQRLLTGR